MNNAEKELIKILFNEPTRLAQITSEQLLNQDVSLIIKAMEVVSSRNWPVHPKTVKDLISSSHEDTVTDEDKAELHALVDDALAYQVENDPDYLIATFREEYNQSILFSALNKGLSLLRTHPSENVVQELDDSLAKMTSAARTVTVRGATEEAFKRIEDVSSGKRPSYWRTGHENLDRVVGWNKAMIVLVAASRKVGKTRAVVDYAMRLMKHNSELDVIWYSFEMKPARVVNLMIAHLTGLDSTYLDGRDGPLVENDLQSVKSACQFIEGMPIKFLDQKCTADVMQRDLRRSVKRSTVVVIDNIGLIEPSSGNKTDIQHEDEMAKKMVDMRDEMDLLMLPIHHLNKQVEDKWNKESLYEPTPAHVRGSSRLTDYANSLLLFWRPDLYQDLEQYVGSAKWQEMKNMFKVKVSLNRDAEDSEIIMMHELGKCRFTEI